MRGGIGTVHRRPDGRWRARLPARLGLRSLGSFPTEEEALAALKAAQEVITPTDSRTLRAWGVIWLRRRKARGLSSFADDQSRWEQHVLAHPIADRPVRALQPREVAAFARWLSTRPRAVQVQGGGWERPEIGAPLSRQTQAHVLKLVQLALQDAGIEGWCTTSPAAAISPVQDQDGAAERRHLTQAQIAQLLKSPLDLPVRDAYQVLLYTGLRPAEAWALRWEVVHLGDRPHLRVTSAAKRSGGVGAPKSAKSRRTVPLLPPAVEALTRIWERAAKPRDGWVFPAVDGDHRPAGDDLGWADRRRGAQELQVGHRAKAGLPEGLVLYSLRHTCATALLHGWWGRRWPLEDVRAWLGHSSVTVTQRYVHTEGQTLLDAARLNAPDPDPTQIGDLSSPAPGLLSRGSQVRVLPGAPSVTGGSLSTGAGSGPGSGRAMNRGLDLAALDPAEQLLRLAAAGRDVPGELLEQVADAALALPGCERDAALVLSGDDRALAAAIRLAGRLTRQTTQQRLRAREG